MLELVRFPSAAFQTVQLCQFSMSKSGATNVPSRLARAIFIFPRTERIAETCLVAGRLEVCGGPTGPKPVYFKTDRLLISLDIRYGT